MIRRGKSPIARARENPTVLACMMKGFLTFLVEQEINPDFLYKAARIAEVEQAGDLDEFPEAVFVEMLERAATYTGRPSIALEALMTTGDRMFGVLTNVLKSTRSLEEAAYHLQRYNQLTGSMGQFEITECKSRLQLQWSASENIKNLPMTMQFRMGLVTANMRWLLNDASMPVDISLMHEELSMKQKYEELFKGTVMFHQPICVLVAPSSLSERPSRTIWKMMSESSGVEWLDNDTVDPAFLHQVLRKFILKHMALSQISVDEAATYCSISSRTLQRWLDQTGIHYQELVDQVRMETAKKLLEQKEIRLARIAFMLGYTAQSNFQTAFRRWTGMSPGDYRTASLKKP